MKINIFNLKQRQEDWKDIKRALHQVWASNSTGALLPSWCDMDFQQAFNRTKKEYSLKELKTILKI